MEVEKELNKSRRLKACKLLEVAAADASLMNTNATLNDVIRPWREFVEPLELNKIPMLNRKTLPKYTLNTQQ